ncbi:zinc finger protein 341-like [Tubulanus polymorphus]|uniref:zinc finger protein 341-like n=1 Tax=Tubulanus polymorphus TaxID=672921 RepID=UPI003DA2A4A9
MAEPAPEMTHSLFEVLAGGVNLDPQTTLAVQSLLDSQSVAETTQVEAEEDDLFVCGKCKKQFTSLPLFVSHKQTRCTPMTNSSSPTQNIHDKSLGNVAQFNSVSTSPVPSIGQSIVLNDDLITTFTNIDGSTIQVVPTSIQNNPFLSQISPVQNSSANNGLSTFTISASSFTNPIQTINMQTGQQMPSAGTMVTVQDAQNTKQTYQASDLNKQKVSLITVIPDMTPPEQPQIIKPLRGRAAKSNVGSEEKKRLKCQYCAKTFLKNFDLQQHIRSHTGEKPFQCIVCGRAFAQKSNVKKHMQTHKVWPNGTSSTLPRQPVTEKIAEENKKDEEEMPISVETPEFQVGVQSHTDEAGNVNIVIDNAYLCQYCPQRFKSYYHLKTHMVQHKTEQVYRCVLKSCSMTFHELDAFLDHTKSHESELVYRCHMCSKQFPSLYELGVHQYSHSLYPNQGPKPGIRYFKCSKCGSKYSSAEALENHMETVSHHHICDHCGKVFTCERYLRRHLTTHGTRQHGCPTCGKVFHTEYYLKSHMLIHTGLKPFKCSKCPSSFNRSDKLKRHMTIHETVKKYKCPFRNHTGCQKAFNRPDKLKAHIISHSGIKPHKCKECGKAFSRRPHLRDHERAHRKDFRFKCRDCNKGFFRQKLLDLHKCKMASFAKMEESLTTTTVRRRVGRPRKVIEVLAEDATKAGEAVVDDEESQITGDPVEDNNKSSSAENDDISAAEDATGDLKWPAKKRGRPRLLGVVADDNKTELDTDKIDSNVPRDVTDEMINEENVIIECSNRDEYSVDDSCQSDQVTHLQIPQIRLEELQKSVQMFNANGQLGTIHIATIDGTTQICVNQKDETGDIMGSDNLQTLEVHQMEGSPLTLVPITLPTGPAYVPASQVYSVTSDYTTEDVDPVLQGRQNMIEASADILKEAEQQQ